MSSKDDGGRGGGGSGGGAIGKRGEAYRSLLLLLGNDVRYVKHLCGAAQPSEFEPLSQALIHVFSMLKRPLVLIRVALAEEYARTVARSNNIAPSPVAPRAAAGDSGKIKNNNNNNIDSYNNSTDYIPPGVKIGRPSHPQSNNVLRVASMASRLMAAYVRIVGSSYLCGCLSQLLTDIVTDESKDFEIDPKRIAARMESRGVTAGTLPEGSSTPPLSTAGGSNTSSSTSSGPDAWVNLPDSKEVLAIVERNTRALLEACEAMFDKITSRESLAKMPREIRAIAHYVVQEARNEGLIADPHLLVGAFLMLRIYNPATVSPEAYDLLPAGVIPTPSARRNLVLMSKVMQNLSNEVLFGKKEAFMAPCNAFIGSHVTRMRTFLSSIGTDPLSTMVDRSLNLDPEKHRSTEWDEFEPAGRIASDDIDLTEFEYDHLKVIHVCLDKYSDKVLLAVQNEAIAKSKEQQRAQLDEEERLRRIDEEEEESHQRNNSAKHSNHSSGNNNNNNNDSTITNHTCDHTVERHKKRPEMSALSASLGAQALAPPTRPASSSEGSSKGTRSSSNSSGGSGRASSQDGVYVNTSNSNNNLYSSTGSNVSASSGGGSRGSSIVCGESAGLLRPPSLIAPRVSLTSPADDGAFVEILTQLGPPPGTNKVVTRPREMSIASKKDKLLEVSFQNYLEHIDSIDTEPLVRANFFFAGGLTLTGAPVFYLIVRRVDAFVTADMNALVLHIFKVCGERLNKPYALVIDMSWATLGQDARDAAIRRLKDILSLFSRNQKKNLEAVFIVHPTSFVQNVMWVMRPFVSSKLRRKIFQIFEWKNLFQYIDEKNLALPDDSKNVVTRSYNVIKVNSKGRKQERLIKLTANSLLNIDPKTKAIKNEKLFSQIEVEVIPDAPELIIHFTDGDENAPGAGGSSSGGGSGGDTNLAGYFFSSNSTAEDLRSRRYLCESITERDQIVQDIYDATLLSSTLTLPQAYAGVEIDSRGKRKDRVYKFSCDSLMSLKGNVIRMDVHFDGLESICVDQENPNIFHIRYKFESADRTFESATASMFVQALGEAMARFREKERRASQLFEDTMKSRQLKAAQRQFAEEGDVDEMEDESFDDGGVFGSF